MAVDFIGNLIHDQIIRASASTYNTLELDRRGWKIALNTSSQKIQYIGAPPNQIYPEVVVWQPDNPLSTTGRAVIIEVVETTNTINMFSLDKWRRLASIGIPFNLVVPAADEARVREMLRQAPDITNVIIQTYYYDQNQQRYIFNTIRR